MAELENRWDILDILNHAIVHAATILENAATTVFEEGRE